MYAKGTEKNLKGGMTASKKDIWAGTVQGDPLSPSGKKRIDCELKGTNARAGNKDICSAESRGDFNTNQSRKQFKPSEVKGKKEFSSDTRDFNHVEGA